jgi:hypothetical protein
MPKLSGGGINSRVVKRVGVRTGPANTNKISPRGVSQYGYSPGSTLRREGSFTTQNSALPVNAGTMSQIPLGNAVALNVKGGAPGAGRTIHRTGSQSQHGSVVQGSTPTPRDTLAEDGPETSSRGSLVRR